MSTEPKESEDVFAFLAANPDKLAKAQIHIPGSFHIDARNECPTEIAEKAAPGWSVTNLRCSQPPCESERKTFQLISRGQTRTEVKHELSHT